MRTLTWTERWRAPTPLTRPRTRYEHPFTAQEADRDGSQASLDCNIYAREGELRSAGGRACQAGPRRAISLVPTACCALRHRKGLDKAPAPAWMAKLTLVATRSRASRAARPLAEL